TGPEGTMNWLLQELGGRGAGVVLGMVFGAAVAWLLHHWRRLRDRRRVLRGDARDTVVIAHHLVETEAAEGVPGGKAAHALRIRSLGQAELDRVVPNGHLAAVLQRRACGVTPRDTLISMEGHE